MKRKLLKFSEIDKDYIVSTLVNKQATVTHMANLYYCHPRSINRIMEERGIAGINGKLGGNDTQRIKKLFKDNNLTIDSLQKLLVKYPNTFKVLLHSTEKSTQVAALFQPIEETRELVSH